MLTLLFVVIHHLADSIVGKGGGGMNGHMFCYAFKPLRHSRPFIVMVAYSKVQIFYTSTSDALSSTKTNPVK